MQVLHFQAISGYRGVLHCKGYDYEDCTGQIMDAPLSEPFSARTMKVLIRLVGFMVYGTFGVNFYPTVKCCIQRGNLGYVYLDPDLFFTYLGTTAKLVMELLIARCTLVVLLSRMNISEKNGHA